MTKASFSLMVASLVAVAVAVAGSVAEAVPTATSAGAMPAPGFGALVAATPQEAASPPIGRARFTGFAANLAEQPTLSGPDAWPVLSYDDAWAALAGTTSATRQQARWMYARSLIGQGRGSEALGVLEVMKSDDPDLTLVNSWQLARGAALTQLGRHAEALDALRSDVLTDNPEACAWRMRSLGEAGFAGQALGQVHCALAAINARSIQQRARFVLAASRAALGADRPAQAITWLAQLRDRDPAANLLRGKAYIALGEAQEGRLRLGRVGLSGTAEERMDAKLSILEGSVGDKTLAAAAALKELDHIRFAWRGGEIEKRALLLTAQLSAGAHDTGRSLLAGAALFRYFNLGTAAAPTLNALRAQFTAALAADSGMPLDKAAGLYWEFRDLAPAGAEGDLLVSRLADRLQAAGLYARAAELLQYQMTARAQDIAQGPLSVRVASLHILAGRPDRALAALRSTRTVAYPDWMLEDRCRIEAVALHLLGRTSEALAVLEDVPDGRGITAEIFWQKHDWTNLVASGEAELPTPGSLNEVEQTIVLRHAIGLAMLGQERAIAGLKARYSRYFAKLPSAATFNMLTQPVGSIDSSALSKAMASLPTASPAGAIANLLAAETIPHAGVAPRNPKS